LSAPNGSGYKSISGSFVVPNAYPPPNTNDDTYRCFTTIGFDGIDDDVMALFGVKSEVTVDGSEVTQSSVLFALLQQEGDTNPTQWLFYHFEVRPGDLITVDAWMGYRFLRGPGLIETPLSRPSPPMPPPPFPDPTGARGLPVMKPVIYIHALNHGAGTAFSSYIDVTKHPEGKTAEWVMYRTTGITPMGKVTASPLPNYGATFIHDTYARTDLDGGEDQTVDDAQLFNMKDPNDVIVSTAQLPKRNILEVYAYTDEPSN